jgi:hypothetical protein
LASPPEVVERAAAGEGAERTGAWDAAPDVRPAVKRRNGLRAAAALVYAVSLGVSIAAWGLPRGREDVFIRVILALLVISIGNLRAWGRGVLYDWLPLLALLTIYDHLRGRADQLGIAAHVRPQLAFDRLVALGTTPTERLQRALYTPGHLHLWDYVAWTVYTSHFLVMPVVGAFLWRRDHPRFRQLMVLYVALTFLGFVTYALYPAMPPWMASTTGHMGPTTRIVRVMWAHSGVNPAAAVFKPGNGISNDVAAVPSLHAAYPMLLLLFFWGSRRRLRPLLVAYTLAMAVTLVYGAEHFVVDILLGWMYAAAVFAVWTSLRRRSRGPEHVVRHTRV